MPSPPKKTPLPTKKCNNNKTNRKTKTNKKPLLKPNKQTKKTTTNQKNKESTKTLKPLRTQFLQISRTHQSVHFKTSTILNYDILLIH